MTEFEIQVLMRSPEVVKAMREYRYAPWDGRTTGGEEHEEDIRMWKALCVLCGGSRQATEIWDRLWKADWEKEHKHD